MVIDRNKHNKYSVNQVYTQSDVATTDLQTLSGSKQTIIYSNSGGSGLTEELKNKLDSIEEGAQVNQNAFSTIQVSDGSITNEITAENPSDTIKFTYVSPIKISLIDGNILISYNGDDALWSLDEDGNLWTDRNVYSTKEISAYGLGEGSSPSGGSSYLYELLDVDSSTASSPIDKGILLYDATKKKWVVTDGSSISPDTSIYATKLYVAELINLLIGSAPDVLDTIYEIAEALNNDPDYVKDIANNLSNLTNRVVKLEDMFEWDGDKIKAKADLYGIGEISAYGYGSGSASSGVSYLRELLDVNLTNIADQCILQYNSSTEKWEATDGSTIRPDLSGYATIEWVTSQINTASLELEDQFNADITNINDQIVVINGNITVIQGNINTINEDILSIKANITSIKNDITNINAALELLNKMFEWNGDKIKAKADLYSVGEISAYGYQDGGATSGASYLHELLDVTLTELTSGLLLQWNGSKWVNINKDEVGLNEEELLEYLTNNGYAKLSDIPTSFDWTDILNKPNWIGSSKPSYTWEEIIGKPTTFTPSEHTHTVSQITDFPSTWAWSSITGKPTTLSGYGITDGVNSVTISGSGNAVTTASINGHVITLTKGNTFSLSTHNHDSVYVNVTGDTMTGTLTLPIVIVNTRIELGNAYIEYDSTNNAVVIKNKITDEVVNFYATGEVSAYGVGTGGSSVSGIDEEQLWSILGNTGTEQISKTHLTTALSGYATEDWVENKGYITSYINNYLTSVSGSGNSTVTFARAGLTSLTWNAYHVHAFASLTDKPTTLTGYGITDAVTIGTTQTITGTKTFETSKCVLGGTELNDITNVNMNTNTWGDTTSLYAIRNALSFKWYDTYWRIGNIRGGSSDSIGFGIGKLQSNGKLSPSFRVAETESYVNNYKVLHAGNYTSTLDSRYVLNSGDTMTGQLNLYVNGTVPISINNTNASQESCLRVQTGSVSKSAFGWANSFGSYLYNYASNKYIGILDNGTPHFNLNTIWHAGNDGSGSGLDADLLDGYDSTGYCRRYSSTNSGTSGSSSWENKLPQDVGLWYGHESNVGNFTLFNQQFSQLIIRDTSDVYYRYRHWKDGWVTSWVKLANITDNVASATKLQTARTIWGQSFDGTDNVDGDLIINGSLYLTGNYAFFRRNNSSSGFYFVSDTDGSFEISGHNNFSYTKNFIRVNYSDGNVGIGTTSPSYKLHVAGTSYATSVMSSNIRIECDNSGVLGSRGGEINSYNTRLYLQHNTANDLICCGGGGNIGVGISTPSYKLHVNGTIYSTSEIISSSANAFRAASGNYGFIIRNDSSNTYFMLTNSGDAYGSWNNLRPLYINNSTGLVYMGQGISVSGAASFGSTLSIASTSIFTGKTTHNGGIQVNGSSFFNLGDATLKFYAADAGNSTGSETFCLQSCFDGLNGETSTYPNSYPTRTVLSLQPRGGYVGIGTVSPDAKFHVYGGRSHFVGVVFADAYNYNGNNNAGVVINKAGANYAGIGGNGTSNEIKFGKCSIDGVWISESQNWNFEGNIVATGEITAYSSSDIRLKKNLKELKAIDTLRKINTFEYDWTEEALLLKVNKNIHDYGIIAQELELIIPEAVTHNMYGKGYLGIDYTKLIPFTISAIKEVDDEVTILKNRVKELEDRLSKYESSIE